MEEGERAAVELVGARPARGPQPAPLTKYSVDQRAAGERGDAADVGGVVLDDGVVRQAPSSVDVSGVCVKESRLAAAEIGSSNTTGSMVPTSGRSRYQSGAGRRDEDRDE